MNCIYAFCRYAECHKYDHYAEYRYAWCRYGECHKYDHYAECRYAECHYAESRGTFYTTFISSYSPQSLLLNLDNKPFRAFTK